VFQASHGRSKFDQTSTDPSKLVFIAKLRVLKHQVFDEPLPFSNGKTIYAHLVEYSKKINLRLDCDFNSGGGGTLSLNRNFAVWDARSSAKATDPNACKKTLRKPCALVIHKFSVPLGS
jgi:hypothetical protein